MESIEDKHKQFEVLHASPAPSSESSNEKGRKQWSLPELQVCMYLLFHGLK